MCRRFTLWMITNVSSSNDPAVPGASMKKRNGGTIDKSDERKETKNSLDHSKEGEKLLKEPSAVSLTWWLRRVFLAR